MAGLLELDASAPQWARNFAFAVKRALDRIEIPAGPVKAWMCRTVDELPRPASKHAHRAGLCLDVGGGVSAWVYSDGTDWRRADTGAVI